MKYLTYCIGIAFSFLFTGPTSVFAQSTAFTYQGRLIDNGMRANGSYDLSFALYDAASNGSLVGSAITNSAVAVSNGLFTTSLDFGAGAFTNGSRWLEIGERTNGSGSFTVLTPRQALTAAPYAVAAGTLTGSLPASQLSGTIPLAQLSGAVLTNGATSVNLSGAFSGDGAGITNLNLMTADSSGTIGRLTNYLTSFTLASSPNVGAGPNSIATVDVNGDGKVDLISANTSGNTLTVLTNTGTGGFTTASTYGVGDYPESVAAADVNGDGKMDLICANSGSIYGAGSLTVLTNDGGGGFMTANTYNLGGNPRSVAAADVNGDGKVDLICANNGRGTLTVLTNDGSGGFMTSGTYSVGNYLDGLVFVATADINGDGKVDLISVNAGNNLLTVLTNDGTGGFVTSGTYGLGLQPVSVAVADINGDHKPDLICAIEQWSSLMVLTNDGSGGFVMAGNYDTGGGGYPFSVAAADMNGDGHVDLISACVGGNTLTVLTNDNSGGFTLAGTYPVANYPYFVTTADVNGDGRLDLIGADYGDNALVILTNQTTVTYTPTVAGNGAGLTGFTAAQIPNLDASKITDGTIDAARLPSNLITNLQSDIMLAGIFSGDGAGLTNLNASQLSSGTMALAQLPAAVVTNTETGVTLAGNFAGNGAGLMNLNASQLSGGTVALAQLPTAVVTNGASGVNLSGTLTGNGTGLTNVNLLNQNSFGAINPFYVTNFISYNGFVTASTPQVSDFVSSIHSVCAADVNGDGKVDLICASQDYDSLTILTNDGSGGFVIAAKPAVGRDPYFVCAADVNGDGKVDLITANLETNTLTILTNNGSGRFSLASSPGVGAQPEWVCAADVNGDGKIDLISANSGDDTLTILTNNGSGGFALASSPGVSDAPASVCAADVNGDGKIDLISANVNGANLTVLTNNGSGSFTTAASLGGINGNPLCVCAADVNGDGKIDLISANEGANTLTIFTNNGNGGFALAATLHAGSAPDFVCAVDVNGDGKIDLINANNNGNALLVFTNNGTGGFVQAPSIGVDSFPYSVCAADVNGDGKIDLISASGQSLRLTVLTNASVTAVSTNLAIAANYTGNGSGLTGLNASQISSGTIPLTQLPAAVVTNLETGVTLGGTFTGNGGGLTNLNAAQLTGVVPGASLTSVPAASLTGSGTLPASVLPATVVLNNASGVTLSGTFNGNLTGKATSAAAALLATNVVSGISITNAFITNSVFAGNGGSLTNVNAISLGGSQATLTANGVLLNTNLNLNGLAIYLRSPGDANHGLGYASSATNFTGAPDGPILWGFGGGALGSTDGGSKLGLVWTKNGVGIGTNSPQTALHVVGDATVSGNVQVGANYATVGAENVRVIRGIINGNGDVVGGSGFTVTTNATTGRYAITFTTAFNAAPTITATSGGLPAAIATVIPASDSQVILYFYSLGGAQVIPGSFNFIAVGP